KEFPVSPRQLAALISLVDDGKVNFSVASQRIYPELLKGSKKSPLDIAQEMNLIQESDEESLMPIIESVLSENDVKVAEYRSGKKGLLGMFMGQVMKKSKGKADPKVANKILMELLEN
ncbi:MAG TPA: hypothetical protein VKZ51_06240, partial [Cyclobacteriaceae bacterium]|nr:hypothetical protein [Cyclobacteriaceae bacterium]